jgi:hydrogenase/urease accessory protein HupE
MDALRRLAPIAALLLALLIAGPASAHTVGVSRGEYRRVPAGLSVSLAFARTELALAGGGAQVPELIDVRAGTRCRPELGTVTELERDGVQIEAFFRCNDGGPIRVSFARLLRELGRGHRHEAVRVSNGASTLIFEAEPELLLANDDPAPRPPIPAAPDGTSVLGFLRLGIEHILTGYDHLVFLLGLVIVGLGTRRTLVVASAFALAHSLSLAACALGAWTPPSSVVEPAIALSIAYVGIENIVTQSHQRRAWLAFAFGLIHGCGFASALSEVNFDGTRLLLALFGFNAGVELGQLLVLSVLLPLVTLLLARPTVARHGIRAVSIGVAASGIAWFVTRVYELA